LRSHVFRALLQPWAELKTVQPWAELKTVQPRAELNPVQPLIRATESSHGIEQRFVGSREKSSRGSDSPRRPTRSGLRILLQVPSAACGTRPRELSNGWARKRMRDRIRAAEFKLHDCAKSTGRSVERCDLWARKRMRDRISNYGF
jgi:hypothetical protein